MSHASRPRPGFPQPLRGSRHEECIEVQGLRESRSLVFAQYEQRSGKRVGFHGCPSENRDRGRSIAHWLAGARIHDVRYPCVGDLPAMPVVSRGGDGAVHLNDAENGAAIRVRSLQRHPRRIYRRALYPSTQFPIDADEVGGHAVPGPQHIASRSTPYPFAMPDRLARAARACAHALAPRRPPEGQSIDLDGLARTTRLACSPAPRSPTSPPRCLPRCRMPHH